MDNFNSENIDQTLYFNGVNGATGGYLFEPQTVAEVSEIAQKSIIAEQIDGLSVDNPIQDKASHLSALIKRDRNPTLTKGQNLDEDKIKLGTIEGVDRKKLSEAGWGIIFPKNIDPAIREALGELIKHRQQEAGDYFQQYEVSPGETVNEFLFKHNANVVDPADPRKVPYYLLIVGDFETIPFDFQCQLDVQYAVGRIYFNTPQEYAQYAHSVVEAETTHLSLPCRAKLFGTRNPNDRSTQESADHLVKPLSDFFKSDEFFLNKNAHWQIETHLAEDATKAQLRQLLGGEETPALLFTASHGVGFPSGDSRQIPHQGAIVCQEWPGFRDCPKPMPEDYYFSAHDISESDRLFGLISFHFACFGAGTLKLDQYGHRKNNWRELAPSPFLANLPQRLLSHPKGGALAFVSHVDRAWGHSYYWGGKENISSFQSTFQRLMEGHPIGSAVEYFNERYAAVASELTKELWQLIKAGKKANNFRLSYLWTANNDARGYVIIGDPAVRLMVGNNTSQTQQHPESKSVEFTDSQSNQSNTSDDALAATQAQQISENLTGESLSDLITILNHLVTEVERFEQKPQPSKTLSNQLITLLSQLAQRVEQYQQKEQSETALSTVEELLNDLIKRIN